MSYRILCIDDDPHFLLGIKAILKRKYHVYTAQDFGRGLEFLRTKPVDLVFLDVCLGCEDGIRILKKIKSEFGGVDVVMLSGHRDPEVIVHAMREGASNYLCKPHPAEELITIVETHRKNKEVRERYDALIEGMNEAGEGAAFIGESKAFARVLEQAKRLKGHGANVLLEGASGTGKELLARYIHNQEANSKRPFIAVNCAAIPDTLIETELFGHEQGAFTGAARRRIGKFELANGGDIFLDEINSLKPELQAKLLRILQEKEFYRVGGTQSLKVNFRVIAATNVDLNEQVALGNFRRDLLYRLRVITLKLPSLKERLEDIPVLADHFLKKHNRNGSPKTISHEVYEKLKAYSWPGNVRELENMIQSLIIMSKGSRITLDDLPAWLINQDPAKPDYESMPALRFNTIKGSLKEFMNRAERDYMLYVIRSKHGNITEAAKELGVSRSKVYYTLKPEALQ